MTLTFDLFMEKLELVAAGGISPVRTDPDLVKILFFGSFCCRGHTTSQNPIMFQVKFMKLYVKLKNVFIFQGYTILFSVLCYMYF